MTKPENQSKSALLYDYITEIDQLTDKYFTHHYIRKNVTIIYNLIHKYQQTQISHSKLVYHDHQLIFTSTNPYLKSQKLKVLATYDDIYLVRYNKELYEVKQHDVSN